MRVKELRGACLHLLPIAVLCLSGCPATPAKQPAVSVEQVVETAHSIAAKNTTLTKRVLQKATPWVETAENAHNLGLPPGFSSSIQAQAPHHGNQPFKLHFAGATVQLQPVGAKPSPVAFTGKQAVYREVYPSTDAILVASAEWVEQLWLLRGPRAPRRFVYDVTLEKGVHHIRVQKDGSVSFLKKDGSMAFRMPRPFAVDSLGKRFDATMEWNGKRLVMSFPEDAAFEFPVLVDPLIGETL